jgi:hypothetical protein
VGGNPWGFRFYGYFVGEEEAFFEASAHSRRIASIPTISQPASNEGRMLSKPPRTARLAIFQQLTWFRLHRIDMLGTHDLPAAQLGKEAAGW